jgi:hypothetical protein
MNRERQGGGAILDEFSAAGFSEVTMLKESRKAHTKSPHVLAGEVLARKCGSLGIHPYLSLWELSGVEFCTLAGVLWTAALSLILV